MSQLPSISDGLKDVVAKTETALIANTALNWGTLPKKLYFMHGTVKEVSKVLQAYTNSPTHGDKKYPLVILVRDVKEDIITDPNGLCSLFKCRLLIVTITSPTYRSDERELNNFKPILIPIFEEIINQIQKSRLFGMPTIKEMQIKKWDCYFYGSNINDKNQFNDFVDAIDIESISLKTKNICVTT